MDIAFKVKAKNGILQKFIDSKKWTQSDFARALGVSAVEAGEWFNMKSYPKTESRMFKLCELVGKLPEEIFPYPMMDKDWLTGVRDWTIHREIDIEFLPINTMLSLPDQTRYLDEINENNKDYLYRIIKESRLTKRERIFIDKKFGLNEEEPLTTKQISEKFDLSYERINQIKKKCLGKMRNAVGRISASDSC